MPPINVPIKNKENLKVKFNPIDLPKLNLPKVSIPTPKPVKITKTNKEIISSGNKIASGIQKEINSIAKAGSRSSKRSSGVRLPTANQLIQQRIADLQNSPEAGSFTKAPWEYLPNLANDAVKQTFNTLASSGELFANLTFDGVARILKPLNEANARPETKETDLQTVITSQSSVKTPEDVLSKLGEGIRDYGGNVKTAAINFASDLYQPLYNLSFRTLPDLKKEEITDISPVQELQAAVFNLAKPENADYLNAERINSLEDQHPEMWWTRVISDFGLEMLSFGKGTKAAQSLSQVSKTATNPLIAKSARVGEVFLKTINDSIMPHYTLFSEMSGFKLFSTPSKYITGAVNAVKRDMVTDLGDLAKKAEDIASDLPKTSSDILERTIKIVDNPTIPIEKAVSEYESLLRASNANLEDIPTNLNNFESLVKSSRAGMEEAKNGVKTALEGVLPKELDELLTIGQKSPDLVAKAVKIRAERFKDLMNAQEVVSSKLSRGLVRMGDAIGIKKVEGYLSAVRNAGSQLIETGDVAAYKQIIQDLTVQVEKLADEATIVDIDFVKELIKKQPKNISGQLQNLLRLQSTEAVVRQLGEISADNEAVVRAVKDNIEKGLIAYKLNPDELKKLKIVPKDLTVGDLKKLANNNTIYDEVKYLDKVTLERLGIPERIAERNTGAVTKLVGRFTDLDSKLSAHALQPTIVSNIVESEAKRFDFRLIKDNLANSTGAKIIDSRIGKLGDILIKPKNQQRLKALGLWAFYQNADKQLKAEIAKLVSAGETKVFTPDMILNTKKVDTIFRGLIGSTTDSLLKGSSLLSANDRFFIQSFRSDPSIAIGYVRELLNQKPTESLIKLKTDVKRALRRLDHDEFTVGNKGVRAIFGLTEDIYMRGETMVRANIDPEFHTVQSYFARFGIGEGGTDMEASFLKHRRIKNLVKEKLHDVSQYEWSLIPNVKGHIGDVILSSAFALSANKPRKLLVDFYLSRLGILNESNITKEKANSALREIEAYINGVAKPEERNAAINSIMNYQELLPENRKLIEQVLDISGETKIKINEITNIEEIKYLSNATAENVDSYKQLMQEALAEAGIHDVSELPDRSSLLDFVKIGNLLRDEHPKALEGLTHLATKKGGTIKIASAIDETSLILDKFVNTVYKGLKEVGAGNDVENLTYKFLKAITDNETVANIAQNSPKTFNDLVDNVKKVVKYLDEDVVGIIDSPGFSLDDVVEYVKLEGLSDILGITREGDKLLVTVNGHHLNKLLFSNVEVSALALKETVKNKLVSSTANFNTFSKFKEKLVDSAQRLSTNPRIIEKLNPIDDQAEVVSDLVSKMIMKYAKDKGIDDGALIGVKELVDSFSQSENYGTWINLVNEKKLSSKEVKVLEKVVKHVYKDEFEAIPLLKKSVERVFSDTKQAPLGAIVETLYTMKKFLSIPRWGIRPLVSPVTPMLSFSWAIGDVLLRDGLNPKKLSFEMKAAWDMGFAFDNINKLLPKTEQIPFLSPRRLSKLLAKVVGGAKGVFSPKDYNPTQLLILRGMLQSNLGLQSVVDVGSSRIFADSGILDSIPIESRVLAKAGDFASKLTAGLRESDLTPLIRLNNVTNNLSMVSNAVTAHEEALKIGLKTDGEIIKFIADYIDTKYSGYIKEINGFERYGLSYFWSTYHWNRTQFGATLFDLVNNQDYARRSRRLYEQFRKAQDEETDKEYKLTDKYGPFWIGSMKGPNPMILKFGANPINDILEFVKPIIHSDQTTTIDETLDNLAIEARWAAAAMGYDLKKQKYIDAFSPSALATMPLDDLSYNVATTQTKAILDLLPDNIKSKLVKSVRTNARDGEESYVMDPFLNFAIATDPTGVSSLITRFQGKFNYDKKTAEELGVPEREFLYGLMDLAIDDITLQLSRKDLNEQYENLSWAKKQVFKEGYAEIAESLYMLPAQKLEAGAYMSTKDKFKLLANNPYNID